jgi:hypothetical protein
MSELTELERVRLENNTLRIVLLQQQLQQVQNERGLLIRQLEAMHPGHEWREGYGLVEKEEPESAFR